MQSETTNIYIMEFKMSDKSKKNWQNLMNEMGVESQMTEEALIEKKKKEFVEKVRKEKEHLEHLEKFHFHSAKELIDYVYRGNELVSEDSFICQDKIKLMDNGTIGHWSLWLSDDDCCVLGTFWKTQSKEDFEKWVNSCFSNEDFLDNGYMPYWHRG